MEAVFCDERGIRALPAYLELTVAVTTGPVPVWHLAGMGRSRRRVALGVGGAGIHAVSRVARGRALQADLVRAGDFSAVHSRYLEPRQEEGVKRKARLPEPETRSGQGPLIVVPMGKGERPARTASGLARRCRCSRR